MCEQCKKLPTYSRTSDDELNTTLSRSGSGRNLDGMLAHVFRPITTAFRFCKSCTPRLIRLNHAMSPGSFQGSLPPAPIPPFDAAARMTLKTLPLGSIVHWGAAPLFEVVWAWTVCSLAKQRSTSITQIISCYRRSAEVACLYSIRNRVAPPLRRGLSRGEGGGLSCCSELNCECCMLQSINMVCPLH